MALKPDQPLALVGGVPSKPAEPNGSVAAIASKAAAVMEMRIINIGALCENFLDHGGRVPPFPPRRSAQGDQSKQALHAMIEGHRPRSGHRQLM